MSPRVDFQNWRDQDELVDEKETFEEVKINLWKKHMLFCCRHLAPTPHPILTSLWVFLLSLYSLTQERVGWSERRRQQKPWSSSIIFPLRFRIKKTFYCYSSNFLRLCCNREPAQMYSKLSRMFVEVQIISIRHNFLGIDTEIGVLKTSYPCYFTTQLSWNSMMEGFERHAKGWVESHTIILVFIWT